MAKEQRLIDANALDEAIRTDFWEHFTQCHDTDQVALIDMVCEDIGNAPTVDAIPLTAAELKYLMNDTIAYIWRLEKRGCDKPEFGYDSRKALLEKLKQFYEEHFPERTCSG